MRRKVIVTIFLVLCIAHSASAQEAVEVKEVQGTLTFEGTPVSQVTIENTRTKEGVLSDTNGNYTIRCQKGDYIVFRHISFQEVSILIEDVTQVLNLRLLPKSNQLDNLVLKASSKEEKNKKRNKKFTTSRGNLNSRSSGESIRSLDGATILAGFTSLTQAVLGKFAGSSLRQGRLFLRGGETILLSAPAIWEVDGVIHEDEPPIDLNAIIDIYILSSLASSVRYGDIARGGIIVVKTKYGTYESDENRPENSLLNTQVYKDDAVHGLSTGFVTFEEGFIDKNNPERLKALAFNLQKQQVIDSSLTVFKHIFKLRPTHAQSYRDLAQAYMAAGQYDKAWKLYLSYVFQANLTKEEGIGEIIFNEMEWLYYNKQAASKITQTFKPSYKTKKEFEKDIRVVFEWNTSEAEFDLEFVNPDKLTYTFKHTLVENQPLIENEKTVGYSSKEFSIPEISYKDWLINLTYYGNKTENPTYLKVTTYYDWGRPNQTQKVRVFQLEDTDVKLQLLKYNNNSVTINY